MSTERVHFRLIQTPCCGQLLCWVNPRLPNYCPECGKQVYHLLKFTKPEQILLSDENAWLRVPKSDPQETTSKTPLDNSP